MNRFFEATDRQEVTQGNIRLANALPAASGPRPRFLTGARPRTTQWRDELALFVTTSKPFARTFANRLWYHFMGRGIVDPPDDFHPQNPPSIPLLLEFLAQQARENRFAIRPLIRLLCNSRAYQLQSAGIEPGSPRETTFACRVLKPLSPEQTFDSVAAALDISANESERQRFIRRSVSESLDEDYSETWQYRETVQALLTRLNSSISVPTSDVEQLYWRILSRAASAEERQLCAGHAAEDVAFALLNSNEFFFNH
jgi:hypothetical protein